MDQECKNSTTPPPQVRWPNCWLSLMKLTSCVNFLVEGLFPELQVIFCAVRYRDLVFERLISQAWEDVSHKINTEKKVNIAMDCKDRLVKALGNINKIPNRMRINSELFLMFIEPLAGLRRCL